MARRIKLKDFNPDPHNHNDHTAEGMAALEHSLEQVGIIESITVSAEGSIISGNARHEKIGAKFPDAEPIVIETDGTRPVILKRTDIHDDTPQFAKASILANTVATKNLNLNRGTIEELSAQYGFAIEEVHAERVGVERVVRPINLPIDPYTKESDGDEEKNSASGKGEKESLPDDFTVPLILNVSKAVLARFEKAAKAEKQSPAEFLQTLLNDYDGGY